MGGGVCIGERERVDGGGGGYRGEGEGRCGEGYRGEGEGRWGGGWERERVDGGVRERGRG